MRLMASICVSVVSKRARAIAAWARAKISCILYVGAMKGDQGTQHARSTPFSSWISAAQYISKEHVTYFFDKNRN